MFIFHYLSITCNAFIACYNARISVVFTQFFTFQPFSWEGSWAWFFWPFGAFFQYERRAQFLLRNKHSRNILDETSNRCENMSALYYSHFYICTLAISIWQLYLSNVVLSTILFSSHFSCFPAVEPNIKGLAFSSLTSQLFKKVPVEKESSLSMGGTIIFLALFPQNYKLGQQHNVSRICL